MVQSLGVVKVKPLVYSGTNSSVCINGSRCENSPLTQNVMFRNGTLLLSVSDTVIRPMFSTFERKWTYSFISGS